MGGPRISKLTTQEAIQFCRDYSTGATLSELAPRYGVSLHVAARLLKNRGHVIREDTHTLPPAEWRRQQREAVAASKRAPSANKRDAIVSSFVQNRSWKATAVEAGISQKAVRKVIQDAGIIVDPRAAFVALAPKALKNIANKLEDGTATVAESLGVLKGIGGIIITYDNTDDRQRGGITLNFSLFEPRAAAAIIEGLRAQIQGEDRPALLGAELHEDARPAESGVPIPSVSEEAVPTGLAPGMEERVDVVHREEQDNARNLELCSGDTPRDDDPSSDAVADYSAG
jgi:hypothetical protein